PGGNGGGGSGGSGDDGGTTLGDVLGCSSAPAPVGGVFALSVLALVGRRRRDGDPQ
ncbi:MAG: phytase, partial [Deltaproteobacteria bacterium]